MRSLLPCLLIPVALASSAQAQPKPGRGVEDGLPLLRVPRRTVRLPKLPAPDKSPPLRSDKPFCWRPSRTVRGGKPFCWTPSKPPRRTIQRGPSRRGVVERLRSPHDAAHGPQPRVVEAEVRTPLAGRYPPELDGHHLDTKYILSTPTHSVFVIRGQHEAESTKALAKATYRWDVAAHGEDPDRLLARKERAWAGWRVADGRIPFFYFTGHCMDSNAKTPDRRATMWATHTTGPSGRGWSPVQLDRLVRLAASISPPGVRPRIIFGGCGMGYRKNHAFLKWLAQRSGHPFVVASEARCHNTFWGWPSITNVLIFNRARVLRLGAPNVPADLREWD